jgi:hypothetical protein
MKKLKIDYGLAGALTGIVLMLAAIVGYILNIVKIIGLIGQEISAEIVVRCVGVFFVPMGAIVGWF